MLSEQRTYESPEEAALAGWSSTPSARARVVSVEIVDDRAQIVLAINDDYRDWVYCTRREGRWREGLSGNGPSDGWSNPDVLRWD